MAHLGILQSEVSKEGPENAAVGSRSDLKKDEPSWTASKLGSLEIVRSAQVARERNLANPVTKKCEVANRIGCSDPGGKTAMTSVLQERLSNLVLRCSESVNKNQTTSATSGNESGVERVYRKPVEKTFESLKSVCANFVVMIWLATKETNMACIQKGPL